ncbi:hypothetical protein SK128_023608, partial [Halocaridina rubra]
SDVWREVLRTLCNLQERGRRGELTRSPNCGEHVDGRPLQRPPQKCRSYKRNN